MDDELENEYETELPLWRPLSYDRRGRLTDRVIDKNFLLKCGNFIQAAYDAFDDEDSSPAAGKRSLFRKVKLFDADKFTIHSFLYSSTFLQVVKDGIKSLEETVCHLFDPLIGALEEEQSQARGLSLPTLGGLSNWIGYVAYEKFGNNVDIFVVLRGTVTLTEWIRNLNVGAVPANTLQMSKEDIPGSDDAKVHGGWLSLYNKPANLPDSSERSLRDQIHDSVKKLLKRKALKDLNARVVVTGHSLGGALASLTAYDLAINKIGMMDEAKEAEVTAIVFSTPPVGNKAFKKQVRKLGLEIRHYWVNGDHVPQYANWAGSLLGQAVVYTAVLFGLEGAKSAKDYVDISSGRREFLWTKSRYLNNHLWIKLSKNTMVHNLEVVLHLLAAYNGNMAYELKDVKRSPVLINKNTDANKEAPAFWWKDKEGVHYDEEEQDWKVVEGYQKPTILGFSA